MGGGGPDSSLLRTQFLLTRSQQTQDADPMLVQRWQISTTLAQHENSVNVSSLLDNHCSVDPESLGPAWVGITMLWVPSKQILLFDIRPSAIFLLLTSHFMFWTYLVWVSCGGGGGSSGVVLRRVVVAHGLACYFPSKQSDVCLSRIFTYEN